MDNKNIKVLSTGDKIFIADWSVDAGLENLSSLGKVLGVNNVLTISTAQEGDLRGSIATTILAIGAAEDKALIAELIKHFVCQTVIEGERIHEGMYNTYFEGKLSLVAEIFVLVCQVQYKDFFESGTPEESSQAK